MLFAVGTLSALFPTFSESAAPIEAGDLKRALHLTSFGHAALARQDTERAERYYDDALDLVDGFPSAYVGLGHIAMRDGRYEDALGAYRGALEGWEKTSARLARMSESVTMRRASRAALEVTLLQDAIAQIKRHDRREKEKGEPADSPSPKTFRLENAIVREQAITLPDAPLPLPPPPGELHFLIGNALFKLQRYDEAMHAWHSCLELAPEFSPVYQNLALLYAMRGQPERVEWSLERLAECGSPAPESGRRELLSAAEARAR